MKIELIPTINTSSSIKNRLSNTLKKCNSVKGAIAYWTIPVDYLPILSEKLSDKNSFICVDIHTPTNIDNLVDFAKIGSNIFIHIYELARRIGKEYKLPALMHTKILYFEFDNGESETWIGSHNFTKRAINGINFEASAIVKTDTNNEKDSIFIKDVLDYLHLIKSHCIPFNIEDASFYKLLQGEQDNEDVYDVIEIVGKNIMNLPREKTIQIISKDINSFEKHKLVGKKIILYCFDLETRKEHIFKTTITNAGAIDKTNNLSYDIRFSERRYAIRETNTIAYLHSHSIVDARLLQVSKYFINLDIYGELFHHKIYKDISKKDKIWVYSNNSVHLSRMNLHDIIDLFSDENFTSENINYQSITIPKIIKKGNKNIIALQEFSLKEMITLDVRFYIENNYELDKYKLKYIPSEEIEGDTILPEQAKRKKLIVKRILKKTHNKENDI